MEKEDSSFKVFLAGIMVGGVLGATTGLLIHKKRHPENNQKRSSGLVNLILNGVKLFNQCSENHLFHHSPEKQNPKTMFVFKINAYVGGNNRVI